jgi:anti-sigma regulatory factor (Ser/Thr protein kinase)
VAIWEDSDSIIVEFRDQGLIVEPMAGRLRPDAARKGGRGFWLANQLCDLVQIRAFETGSVVRLHLRIR